MKQKSIGLSQRYVATLRKHPKQDLQAIPPRGTTLGPARTHERALATLELSNRKKRLIKRVEIFFTGAFIPIVQAHRATNAGCRFRPRVILFHQHS
jgi:hypothetical protein